jgi:DNA-binding transcriptional MerR regulator
LPTDETQHPNEPLMKIGELARRAGVSTQVIGSYCMYGLIKEAGRTPKGHRLFDEKSLRRIKLIHDMIQQRDGYTLREIREIFIRDRL